MRGLLRLLITLALLLPTASWAAVAHVGTTGFQQSSLAASTTLTSFAVSSGADRAIVCLVALETNARTVSGITFNTSENFTKTSDHTYTAGAVDLRIEIWHLVNPTVATANVVISISGGTALFSGGCTYMTGVNQSAPLGTAVTSGAGTANPSVAVTDGATGDLVLDLLSETAGSATAGAGQTQAYDNTSMGTAFTHGSWEAGAASVTMSWTMGAADRHLVAINVFQVTPATNEQTHFRWRDDDGSETTATWLANEDTTITRLKATATRLRVQVDTTVADPSSKRFKLQYKLSSDSIWADVPVTSPASGTLDYTVNLGTDDAAEATAGTVATTATTIGASLDATTEWVGMRWDNVTIPIGATITTAYISVVPSGTGEDEPLVTVYFQDADDPATFSTGANDISSRSRTSGVSWSSTDLGANGSTYFNSPSLVTILQAVVNRGGWAAGNAIVAVVQGGATTTRDLTIEAFENAGNNPPKLHVEYTVPRAFEMKASANITASGENTTRQLTIPSGKAGGDFDGGRLQDDENPGDTVDVTLSGFREDEWSIQATANATNSAVYQFRVVDSDDTVMNTYTVTPTWTIDGGGGGGGDATFGFRLRIPQ